MRARSIDIPAPIAAVGLAVMLAAPCAGQAGSLDTTFGTGGRVLTGFAGPARDVVALQADGKLIVVGSAASLQHGQDFALARYNPDGAIDTTFGTNGKVLTDLGGEDAARAIALQDDGKILVAGSSGGFALARYHPDGTLDTGFGEGGKVRTAWGGAATSVVLQKSGKIVLAGSGGAGFGLMRFDASGRLDPTFGDRGIVSTSFHEYTCEALAAGIQSDDRIVVVGFTLKVVTYPYPDWNSDVAVARYTADGSLDSSFGTGGKVTTDLDGDGYFTSDGMGNELGRVEKANGVAIQPDGKIVVIGNTANLSRWALVRYNANGSLDDRFGLDGKVTTECAAWHPDAFDVVIQGDGRIVVAGSDNDDWAIRRYNEDGSSDASFGTSGKALSGFGGGSVAWAVALQAGKIVAAGDWGGSFALARHHGAEAVIEQMLDLTSGVELLAATGVLNQGQATPLEKMLDTAIHQADRGNEGAAIHQLDAFMTQVNAFVQARILSPLQGKTLYDQAAAIVALLS